MLWWIQPEAIALLDPYEAIDNDYRHYKGNWQSKGQTDAAVQHMLYKSVPGVEDGSIEVQQEDNQCTNATDDVLTGTQGHEQITQQQPNTAGCEQSAKRKRKRKATVSQEELDARHPGNERNRAAQQTVIQAWRVFCEWACAQTPICCHIHGALSTCLISAIISTETTETSNDELQAKQPNPPGPQHIHEYSHQPAPTSTPHTREVVSWRRALMRRSQVPLLSTDENSVNNNTVAHEMTDWVSLHAMRHVVHPKIVVKDIQGGDDAGTAECVMNLFGSLVTNSQQREIIAVANDAPVLLPRQSSFLMTDLASKGCLQPLLASGQTFKVIVADPPWENASVRRSGRYPTLPDRVLLQLPIKQLLDQKQGLMLLWMTNREKLHRVVHTELLPAWGLRHVTTWYWLKLAEGGQSPVSCLQTMHRHPFEHLLVCAPADATVQTLPGHGSSHNHSDPARTIHHVPTTDTAHRSTPHMSVAQPNQMLDDTNGAVSSAATEPDCTHVSETNLHQQANKQPLPYSSPAVSDDSGKDTVLKVPSNLVMLSTPSADHSRKPFLGPLLDQLLPGFIPNQGPHPACLELFAREMHSNWASVGNEVLRFQNLALFKPNTP